MVDPTSYQKLGIYFSPNMDHSTEDLITVELGVTSSIDTGRHLGLPSLIGKSRRAIFGFLRDRLWKKLQGWKNHFLSIEGKEILIKSVAQATPSYCMPTFLLLATLCDELQSMMNSFGWGTN